MQAKLFDLPMHTKEFAMENDFTEARDIRGDTKNTGPAHTVSEDLCNITVGTESAQYFKYQVQTWSPNFANLVLKFIGDNFTYERTKDIILPQRWFWTFYSPDGYFPYLKWPVDFSILSFGLLNAKTLPHNVSIDLLVNTPNCSIIMGGRRTTEAIAEAFREMTEAYLVSINERSYSYSYWCYLAERPGERNSWDYFFGVYIGYPSDFEGYNCCRTDVEKTKKSNNLRITCLDHQIKKMYQCTLIPFIISLIVFAYFPVSLTKVSSQWVKLDRGLDNNIQDEDWVYLSGTSPLTFTSVLCGLCGLSKRHPNSVSRFRRFLFMLTAPCVIYIQILVYYHHELINAFIRHGNPMAYLSMLGGFEKSRQLFIPFLGGPYILLATFYLGSFIFVVLPKSLDDIMENGASVKQPNPGAPELYLLNLSDTAVEQISDIPVCKHHGYARLANRCKAGFFMVLNTGFWKYAFATQVERFVIMRRFIQIRSGRRRCLVAYTVVPMLLMLYIVCCAVESIFCIFLYGIPLISFIKYVIRSYMKSILNIIYSGNGAVERGSQQSRLYRLTRTMVTIFVALFFVYYTISFCTIFCASLSFLALMAVFSFLAVIVYPAYSFGYLFFGLAFFYYFFKLRQSFGEVYFELLHDAVEVSGHLESGAINPHMIAGSVVVETNQPEDIDKLQVNDKVIYLTDNQKQKLVTDSKDTTLSNSQKIRYRNHKIGIPRDLFDVLVRKYRPVHIQVVKALMRLILILSLIVITITIVLQGSYQQKASISEVIHVIFIVAVGALPRILELAVSTMTESVKKDIEARRMTATIEQYWRDREFVVIN